MKNIIRFDKERMLNEILLQRNDREKMSSQIQRTQYTGNEGGLDGTQLAESLQIKKH